ncbi:hypothetical protein E3N88_27107 [Mikania micrantha]|uniref:Uncharacterized protein n=1 Tax=Mikania micrantha TaxID=192012 RepID=A0A5N6MWL9_9ASTR|nr:hypothetical protein E3N88_27107 [Mikania micrantha]
MSSSGDILPKSLGHQTELTTESDFEQIVSPDGTLSICGFGSLLSEQSARSTFPDLVNFRVAKLNGFRRVFAHVAPIFFERGIAKPETKEISSLSVEPYEGESLIVTVFEINKSEIPSYIEREHEFRFLAVQPETLEGSKYLIPAVLCARYSDEEYFQNRCKGSQEIYHKRYGQFGIGKIWRDDVLPCRVYCRHCVLAAKNLGKAAHDNFLDHTYLADRKTTLRKYLATTGYGIMEEEPPELLKGVSRGWVYHGQEMMRLEEVQAAAERRRATVGDKGKPRSRQELRLTEDKWGGGRVCLMIAMRMSGTPRSPPEFLAQNRKQILLLLQKEEKEQQLKEVRARLEFEDVSAEDVDEDDAETKVKQDKETSQPKIQGGRKETHEDGVKSRIAKKYLARQGVSRGWVYHGQEMMRLEEVQAAAERRRATVGDKGKPRSRQELRLTEDKWYDQKTRTKET